MKWFWKRCRRRSEAGLLAAGALDGEEKAELENHLAACGECRTYYSEIKIATAPLRGWEKNLAAIEATPVARSRWTRAVNQTMPAASSDPGRTWPGREFCRAVWRELILPSRYAWSGLAVLWAAMLVVNIQLSDHLTRRSSASPQEIIQAWEEQNRIFAEWTRPNVIVPVTPARLPRPRGQRARDWAVI